MQKGSVIEYRRKDGDVVFRVQFRDARGRQVKRTLGRRSEGWTKRKAQAELAELVLRVEKKGYTRPEPVKFDDYAVRWLEEMPTLEGWKPSTVYTYRFAVRTLTNYFGQRRLGDIRPADVNAHVAHLLAQKMAERTVNLIVTVLHSIYKRAVKEKLVDANPASGADRPKEPRYPARRLTPEEAQAVSERIDDPTVKLAALTFELLGIRFAELRNLRWRAVDTREQRLRIEDSKTPEGERTLHIPRPLNVEFIEHRLRTPYQAPDDFVFCNPQTGKQLRPEHYRKTIHAARQVAGLPYFRPAHEYRVTSLTEGAMAGESPVILMRRAGHTNYETTRRYLDLAGATFPDEGETLAARRLEGRVDTA